MAADGTIYLHEHGARGGDETNILTPAKNYGWPALTHGIDYNGAYISPFNEAAGMESPIHHWTPSIAPSGLAVYEGHRFPDWQGDLFVGALVDREVRRLDMENGEVTAEEPSSPNSTAASATFAPTTATSSSSRTAPTPASSESPHSPSNPRDLPLAMDGPFGGTAFCLLSRGTNRVTY